ncbi:IPExxxVDY family protein [Aureibaculum marinum]|uniref:IPExxxVDY family protein n=1 Tax=Aureibaculum marinum TaxID=2487930 RepID=A0A3N4NAL6_9FLAO|nr:IPExxxVDY family protein [Aureibaculum marinum]RPD91227.1 IPExxxVDY family protein [Aureibaculum marinum]
MSKILSLGFEFEHDYILIGINSTLEDYRLAYFLNREFNIKLNCKPEGLCFNDKDCSFSFYDYECNTSFSSWSLLANKQIHTSANANANNLFHEDTKTNYLINEKKEVDFFLKIDGDIDLEESELTKKIKNIKGVITSYIINPQNLKSKDYLIF